MFWQHIALYIFISIALYLHFPQLGDMQKRRKNTELQYIVIARKLNNDTTYFHHPVSLQLKSTKKVFKPIYMHFKNYIDVHIANYYEILIEIKTINHIGHTPPQFLNV